MSVGDTVAGVLKCIKDFGAFVNLGNPCRSCRCGGIPKALSGVITYESHGRVCERNDVLQVVAQRV